MKIQSIYTWCNSLTVVVYMLCDFVHISKIKRHSFMVNSRIQLPVQSAYFKVRKRVKIVELG